MAEAVTVRNETEPSPDCSQRVCQTEPMHIARLDPATAETPPLLSVQVLRAVAALLVLIHHAGYDADTIAERTARTAFSLDRFFDWGFGIHLFFVISGFILVRTARNFGSARGSFVFLTRRLIRVVPLYWLMTSLVLAGAVLAPELLNMPIGGLDVAVGSYLFVPVLRPGGELRPILGQGWTLDYEMFFYALFTMSMLLPRRSGLTVLISALIVLVLIGQFAHPASAALGVWTDGLLLEFLFGLAIGLVEETGSRLGTRAAVVGVIVGIVAAVAFGPACKACGGVQTWVDQGLPAAAIVGACVLGPRWPRSRWILALTAIGDASYSLYLSHPFVVRLLRTAWLAVVPATVPLEIELALGCLAAIAAALLLHRGIEAPMTLWFQKRSRLARSVPRPILVDLATPTLDDER